MPDDLKARLDRAFAEGKPLILSTEELSSLQAALSQRDALLKACRGLIKSTTVNGQVQSMMPSCGAFADLYRAMREAN